MWGTRCPTIGSVTVEIYDLERTPVSLDRSPVDDVFRIVRLGQIGCGPTIFLELPKMTLAYAYFA